MAEAIPLSPEEANQIVRSTPPGPRRDALLQALRANPPPAASAAGVRRITPDVEGRIRLQEAKAAAEQAKAAAEETKAAAKLKVLEAQQQLVQTREKRMAERLARREAKQTEREERKQTEQAEKAAQKATDKAAAQKAARLREIEKTGALIPASPALGATSVFATDKDVRLLDAAIVAAAGAGTALWTASRPTTGAQVGWGLFWSVLGVLGAVQGSAELRYFGFGMLGANSGYLALRLIRPDLRPPQPVPPAVNFVSAPILYETETAQGG